MPYVRQKPNPTTEDDLYDVANASVLVAEGGTLVPVVTRSRRTITVDHAGQRVALKRRRLERLGYDLADDGTAFSVTNYETPGGSHGS